MGLPRCCTLALLALAACATVHAQAPCVTTFSTTLANQTDLSIFSQAISALSGSKDGGLFPSASDGVTLLAPTDTAFLTALAASGLSAASATATLGDKVVSILLYHVLPQGAFQPNQLVAAGTVATALGNLLKQSLPLTFGAGSGNGTTVSGVKGTAALGQQITVCSSDVYVIDSLLLPAATITAVPSVLNANTSSAAAPAGALGSSAAGPAFATPFGPTTSTAGALGPASALGPTAFTPAPSLAPEAALAPSPALAPEPAVAAPAPATSPVAATPTTSSGLSPSLISGLALAPSPSGSGAGAFVVMSAATVLVCSAVMAALAL